MKSRGIVRTMSHSSASLFKHQRPDIIPFKVFSLDQCGIDQEKNLSSYQDDFNSLPYDMYDVRRNQLEMLIEQGARISIRAMQRYFEHGEEADELAKAISKLKVKELKQFYSFMPWRQRSIATYKITLSGDTINIKRIPTEQFVQTEALSESEKVDFRKFNRIFSETDDAVAQSQHTKKLIKSIIRMVREREPDCKEFEVNIHHTKVNVYDDMGGDNSPEGLHQDGYDYIVSALVIDRVNIVGGSSKVYFDKDNELLDIVLPTGHGLLQADKDTRYWHKVTKFTKADEDKEEAYRSTIGFDIACNKLRGCQ